MRRKFSSISNILFVLWFAATSISSQQDDIIEQGKLSTIENHPNFIEFDGLWLYCESITFRWNNHDLESCNIRRNLTGFSERSTVIEVLHDDSKELEITFRALLIQHQVMKLVPLDLGMFFRDLMFLRIWSSALEHITKKDLEYFNLLEGIDLVANNLTFLQSDLFVFNTKLRHVDISNNPLHFIGEHFLDHLKNAITIDFMSCNCIHYVYNGKDCGDMRMLRSKLVACSDRRLKFRDTNEIIIVDKSLTNWSEGVSGSSSSVTGSRSKLQRLLIILLSTLTFIWW